MVSFSGTVPSFSEGGKTMICPKCGAAIEDNVKFCTECGEPISATRDPSAESPASSVVNCERSGIPAPGWSDRVNHPDVLAAMKKNSKAAVIFAVICVPLPLLGFVIYSLVSQKMEITDALLYGGIISAVFLVFALISLIRKRTAKPYEATVIEKKSRWVRAHGNSDDDSMVTEYIIYARTTDGKRKKIIEREGSMIYAYDYLNIGDRFRYHPQFNFPYELYDKSKAPYLYCVSCGKKNDVTADRCRRCRTPLLK